MPQEEVAGRAAVVTLQVMLQEVGACRYNTGLHVGLVDFYNTTFGR